MGGDDFHFRSVLGNAVNFLHSSNNRTYVFDDMAQTDEIESIFMEWIRIAVQVMDNVDPLQGFQIEADTPRKFVIPATDIQNLLVQVDNRAVVANHPLRNEILAKFAAE